MSILLSSLTLVSKFLGPFPFSTFASPNPNLFKTSRPKTSHDFIVSSGTTKSFTSLQISPSSMMLTLIFPNTERFDWFMPAYRESVSVALSITSSCIHSILMKLIGLRESSTQFIFKCLPFRNTTSMLRKKLSTEKTSSTKLTPAFVTGQSLAMCPDSLHL